MSLLASALSSWVVVGKYITCLLRPLLKSPPPPVPTEPTQGQSIRVRVNIYHPTQFRRTGGVVPSSLLMMAFLERNNLTMYLRKWRLYILWNRHCAMFSVCYLISLSQNPCEVALVIISVISTGNRFGGVTTLPETRDVGARRNHGLQHRSLSCQSLSLTTVSCFTHSKCNFGKSP